MAPARFLLVVMCVSSVSGELMTILSVSGAVIKGIWNIWMATEFVPDYLCSGDRGVEAKLREISRKLSAAEERLWAHEELVLRRVYSLPTQIKYELKIDKLIDTILHIERAESTFEDYMKVGLRDHFNSTGNETRPRLENETVLDFLANVISHSPTSVRSNMEALHQMVVVDNSRTSSLRRGLFPTFLKYLKINTARFFYDYKRRGAVNDLTTMRYIGFIFILALAKANGAYKRYETVEPIKSDQLRQEVLTKIQELWEETGHPEWQYLAKKKPGGMDGQLVAEFKILSEKIDNVKFPDVSSKIMETLWVWSVVNIETEAINSKWIVFKQSQARPDPLIYGDSWRAVANITLNDSPDSPSVRNSLSSLQDMICDRVETHKDAFRIVKEEAEEHICEAEMSPQQLLYHLFSILQMSQLKAYTMIQFSWLLLRLYNKGNFSTEAEMLRTNYLERMSQQAHALRESMEKAESALWKCDPRIHEEGKTYTEVTKVLQGFLVNEVDLNKESTCREDCRFYKYTKQYSCYKDNYCNQQPKCTGNIVDCQFVDSDMKVCQAPFNSPRRYDWIHYENGRTLGQQGSCRRPINNVDSWWRWLFWHCSFCLCYCDDPNSHQSDRYFNLRAVVSDKTKNKVVTGIRFIKVNRVIHLQIQEGELLPMGGINESSIEWKPVDDYKIGEKGVQVGVDYHMLTWESRAIDLDDIKVPSDSVVTGVKLRRIGAHLNLEVEAAKFNFTEGKLIQSGEKSFWISNDKTEVSPVNPRTQLTLKKPDIPTRSAGLSHPDSKPEQFIEFGPTDLDLDAGQTTIPYIDTQIVAPQPPVPLSGIGIYHKGRDYSGGFIAPKIFTFDFSKHIVENFPEINEATQ